MSMVVTMSSTPGNSGWDQSGASGWDQTSPAGWNQWGSAGWDQNPGPGWGGPGSPPPGPGGSRNGIVWALGALVVVLLVALAGVVGFFLLSPDDEPPVATPPEQSWSAPPVSDEVTVTVTPTAPAPETTVVTQAAPAGDRGNDAGDAGDLGLSVPLTRPACDGRGIVVLYSAVTPGAYEQEIASALAQFPGASYLRTDMACSSLRQRDQNGNVIYAVYRPSGYSQQELCADVRTAGPPAYGRWLDTSSDPAALVTC